MLYAEWLKTNDPYADSFEDFVYEFVPEIKITKLNELEYTIL